MNRVGIGYDSHRFEAGRPLILGGVTIPHSVGLVGHSDADAVCHALTDALLGAANAGDIGQHFSDRDPKWRGADSIQLLSQACQIIRTRGFQPIQADVTVIAQRPVLAPFTQEMAARLADAVGLTANDISVKAKTNEGMGFVGREEGISVIAVAQVAPL